MTKWTIIILGATGDLSKRKLIPALYNSVKKSSTEIAHPIFIGAAYEDVTLDEVLDAACPFVENCEEPIFNHLKTHSHYCQIDFNKKEDFKKLKKDVDEQEKKHEGSGKRLIFCAVPPHFFAQATESLVELGVIEKNNSDHRIVFEKPFGTDGASAREMNKKIDALLHCDQTYRIDHYLTKELVNNIVVLRFTNSILQNTWDNKTVERIEIVINEVLDSEHRGFYDSYGAIKDVAQNHLLQLLALTAMEQPEAISFDAMAPKKAEVLENVTVEDVVIGQYEGYIQEELTANDSKTETFVKLKIAVNTPRWQDVPFYLQTGKCLNEKKKTEIRVIFKQVGQCFVGTPNACENNKLTIRIQPDEGIALQINAREPQDCRDELCRVSHFGLVPVTLDFCHGCLFGPYAAEAYEILFQSIVAGDTEIGVSAKEINAQWKIIEQIDKTSLPLNVYAKGSMGPEGALL